MVAYLKKPEGSEGFHQIVDFLNACHIKYALTENPTIYMAKLRLFTEASVRRNLQLAYSNGISSLPTTQIFEQLSLMGFIQVFLNKQKRQKIGKSSDPAEEPKDKEEERTRKYWKIIRVGNHTEVHQFFDDILKALDMDELSDAIEEGNRHLHAGREGVSIVKRNSYTDAGCKALGGSR
ncbi:hypothetical protein Tco_0010076 [Tanacetum coccineum]